MLISVCVATVRAGTLEKTIEAVRRQTYPNWEMIVVTQGDDAALGALVDRHERDEPRIRRMHLKRGNRSDALNVAMASARGEIFAFTDDDCEPATDWLDVMNSTFALHPDVGLMGGTLVPAPKKRRITISTCPSAHVIDYLYRPAESNFHAPDGFYLLGGNSAISRWGVEKAGTFDATLGPGTPFPACEDLDLLVRCEALDIPMLTTRQLVVDHASGRRYGLRAFLAHHRNYARGRGAYLAKLQMWGHRLGTEWAVRTPAKQRIKMAFTNPARFLLNDLYYGYHQRRAHQQFWDGYELADGVVCRPRVRPS